jgi:ribonuclease HI
MTVRGRQSVPVLGESGGVLFYPEQGITVVPKGDPMRAVDQYAVRVDTDSSFEYSTRIRAVSWELRTPGEFLARRTWGDRQGEGPNHTELLAAIHGLNAACGYGAPSVHLRTDNKLATGILSGLWLGRDPKIQGLNRIMRAKLDRFESVAITWVRTRDIKRVDSEAKRTSKLIREEDLARVDSWVSVGEYEDALKRRLWPAPPSRLRRGRSPGASPEEDWLEGLHP